jgi:hypothetical protein
MSSNDKEREDKESISPTLGDFFINRDYITTSHNFESIEVQLDCLTCASTDFDLTGQVIWPAARLLSHFIAASSGGIRSRLSVIDEDVLELGSGCGLVGLVASFIGIKSITLTDNEPEVLEILKLNTRHACRSVKCRVFELDWGSIVAEKNLEIETGRKTWKLILAADVVFWQEAILPLSITISNLLAKDGVMFLGYFDRATNNKVKLETALIDAGLVFQKISPLDFLIGNELSDLDLMTVYEIKWKVV